jgi:apolipoprotein N-acyltransferase
VKLKKQIRFVIILVLHLVMLKWILYALHEGGVLPFKTLLLHFTGIAIYGAVLIRACAYIYHQDYLKEKAQQ